MNNITVNVLVNSHKVKQYNHEGQIFIEGKDGTEWELEIKNDNPFRVSTIIGVDGLSILDGKELKDNSPEYIIDRFSSLKLKGYRINDNEVAAFKFAKKDKSYASGKSSNPQCGVISLRVYNEKEKPKPEKEYINNPVYPYPISPWRWPYYDNYPPYEYPYHKPIWYYGDTITCGLGAGNMNSQDSLTSCSLIKSVNCSSLNQSYEENKPSENFDLGSSWGDIKESKVVSIEFEKGQLLGEINIYYASKESLEKMGVVLVNQTKVKLPQGFSQYCSPPDNWVKK